MITIKEAKEQGKTIIPKWGHVEVIPDLDLNRIYNVGIYYSPDYTELYPLCDALSSDYSYIENTKDKEYFEFSLTGERIQKIGGIVGILHILIRAIDDIKEGNKCQAYKRIIYALAD